MMDTFISCGTVYRLPVTRCLHPLHAHPASPSDAPPPLPPPPPPPQGPARPDCLPCLDALLHGRCEGAAGFPVRL
jgi:hypothetical protein